MNTVIEDDREEKIILTPEQEESLIAFAQGDPVYSKYADELIILSETGVRISELCGFTTHLDFKNRAILVDHQLLRDAEIGFYIETPKTKSGVRQLHMSEKATKPSGAYSNGAARWRRSRWMATRISCSSTGTVYPRRRPTTMP